MEGTLPTWKRILLKSMGFGAGFAIVVCVAVGTWIWYDSKPKPPKPWNSSALKATDPPYFSSFAVAGKNGSPEKSSIKFTYSILNNTDTDYEMNKGDELKLLLKLGDTVSQPAPFLTLDFPIFIPSKQKGTLTVSIATNSVPDKAKDDTDEQYHEHLRTYIEKELPRDRVSGFVIYDESNKYKVDLPRNLPSKPASSHP
jgi:hypothetical protein